MEDEAPDLILPDVMMPDGLGWDFRKTLRGKTSAPVIFLTCRNEDESVIKGLLHGGDDYIAKPYHLSVLGARIGAQLRRSGLNFAGRIELPPLSIDMLAGTVFRETQLPCAAKKRICKATSCKKGRNRHKAADEHTRYRKHMKQPHSKIELIAQKVIANP